MFKFIKNKKKSILTVLLEVVIVFIGISLSLWIDDWNQNRKDHKDEKMYLKSLYFDISMDVQDLSNRHFDSIEISENIKKLLLFLNYPDSVEMDRNFFQHVMGRSQMLQNFSPTDYTFQEMTSTGKLSLIQDADLRKKLTMYYSIVKRLSEDKQANNSTTRQLLFEGVANNFHVARLFSFGGTDLVRPDDTLDLSVFNDRKSKEFVVVQNYLLLRNAMLHEQAKSYERILHPLVFLKNEIAEKIGIPIREDFIDEMKSGKSAREVYEHYTQNTEFKFVKYEFNNVVYKLISENLPELALDIAILNAELFDWDSNLFDTLGDAYMANNQKDKAIESYKKAIEMSMFQMETRDKLQKLMNE